MNRPTSVVVAFGLGLAIAGSTRGGAPPTSIAAVPAVDAITADYEAVELVDFASGSVAATPPRDAMTRDAVYRSASGPDAPRSDVAATKGVEPQGWWSPIGKLLKPFGREEGEEPLPQPPPPPTLRLEALHYLGSQQAGDLDEVVDQLLISLEDPADQVREEAIRVLGERLELAARQNDPRLAPNDRKVVARLEGYLLTIGPDGRLVEQSDRVRERGVDTIVAANRRLFRWLQRRKPTPPPSEPGPLLAQPTAPPRAEPVPHDEPVPDVVVSKPRRAEESSDDSDDERRRLPLVPKLRWPRFRGSSPDVAPELEPPRSETEGHAERRWPDRVPILREVRSIFREDEADLEAPREQPPAEAEPLEDYPPLDLVPIPTERASGTDHAPPARELDPPRWEPPAPAITLPEPPLREPGKLPRLYPPPRVEELKPVELPHVSG